MAASKRKHPARRARPRAADGHASAGLSHVAAGPTGPAARMVDVGAKPATERSALARARLRFPPGALAPLLARGGPKGPIEEVARTAGILAAKRTSEWIPLCHALALDHVAIEFEDLGGDLLEIRCRAACTGRTGVEMEAMTGVAAAALTVYDMTKAVCRGTVVEALQLVEKRGGRSGRWSAPG